MLAPSPATIFPCMPIRPENKHRYPANWGEIRRDILKRAEHRCEGSPKYPDCRVLNHTIHCATGARVVLTIAHLDHTPENNDHANLRAWCQRCHNTYDAPHRRAGIAARARARLEKRAVLSLIPHNGVRKI